MGEALGGDVHHVEFGMGAGDGIADGLGQMGFSEAHFAKDEEGVKGGFSRPIGYGFGGVVGKAIGVAHDEVVKGVALL